MLKQAVIESSRYLLRPLVRFLLRHGVTWEEFGELSKDAYVYVARKDHGIQGRPTNNSRVAMLTGLSRREVAKVRDRLLEDVDAGAELHGNQLSRILTAWHSDDEFRSADGSPRDLPAEGAQGSFESLLRTYAGDLPHGAVRKELNQRGLIEELKDGKVRVLKRDYVISTLDPSIVRQLGLALHDHAATLEHNLNDDHNEVPRFEGMADNVSMPPESLDKFRQLIESRGLSFLEEVDGWLADNETKGDAVTQPIRLGVGVYLICDENHQGQVK